MLKPIGPELARVTDNPLTFLSWEYSEWCVANDLSEEGDAEDLLRDPRLSGEQREWLADFLSRWEAAI